MRDLPHGFDNYLVNVKTMRKIAHIFVAFSEKLNFKSLDSLLNDSYKNLKICFVPLPKGKIDARNPNLIRFSF